MTESPILQNSYVRELFSSFSLDSIAETYDINNRCASRDVFQAKLDGLFSELNNSLLIAVCGEIGNNSFDHNLGSWRDLSGVIFNHLAKERIIVIADRGQGVRKTLSKILPEISSDLEALKIAFTKVISGRSPEHRGNGLKFVAAAVQKNDWALYFHSGGSYVSISKGKIAFDESTVNIKGCLAVIKY